MDRWVVLVVDDDPDIALVCSLQLQTAGFSVLEAATGEAAVEIARREHPAVILLDYMLPDLDGVEVVRRLRAEPATRGIPIVMLTARTHERDQRAAWRAGVSDYVTKPFDGDRLVGAVRSAARAGSAPVPPQTTRAAQPPAALAGATQDNAWLVGLIQGAHDAIIAKTLEGEITFWNRGAEELYGWHESEAVGRHISMLTSKETEDEIPQILARVARGETVKIYDTVRLHRNGRRLHVSLCVSPILDEEGAVVGASAIARDVSARVLAERRHEQLLEQAPDALVVIDSDGVIELVNRQTEVLFGYTRERLVGQSVEMLVPERFRPEHPGSARAYASASRFGELGRGLALRGMRADGTEFPVEVSFTPMESPGAMGFAATIRDVSERTHAEAQVRSLLDAAPDAIVGIDGDGLITLVNRKTEELFGYRRADLRGRRVDLLLSESLPASWLRPTDLGRTAEPGVGGVPPVELQARRSDQTLFPAEVSTSSYETDDGPMAVAVIRDITERKRAEERVRAVAEAAPDAMTIVAEDGAIQFANAQMVRLFGYSREELVGHQVEMLLPERFRARHEGHRRSFNDSATIRPMGAGQELTGLRKDGSEFAIEISLSPLPEDSGSHLTCAAIRDVTERRLVEEARSLAAAREREAGARLREVDRIRTDFMSTVSHELRTPLTAIKGFSEYLSNSWENTPEDRKRDMLRRIHHAGDRLDTLIQDLLDFSRLERGQLRVDVAPLSLKVVVEEAVQHVGSAVEGRAVSIDVGGALVLADRPTLLRVVENLLTNAAKFSPSGTGIDVAATSAEDFVELTVRDYGVGIAEEEQELVFDRFYRSSATAHAIPGTGIGLAIVKQFISAQGGEVGLRAPTGGGAEFWVRLRRALT